MVFIFNPASFLECSFNIRIASCADEYLDIIIYFIFLLPERQVCNVWKDDCFWIVPLQERFYLSLLLITLLLLLFLFLSTSLFFIFILHLLLLFLFINLFLHLFQSRLILNLFEILFSLLSSFSEYLFLLLPLFFCL